VGNGFVLPATSVGDSVLPRPLYLNNILVAPDIIQNLLSVHCCTTDNSCSIEFDPFGLSVKDLATRNVIIRSISSGLVYTLCLLSHATTPRAFYTVTASTWHCHLGHPGRDTLSRLASTAAISCTKSQSGHLCHACQHGHHTRLPFYSSMSHAMKPFELLHYDL
jgi:hypothetical protein